MKPFTLSVITTLYVVRKGSHVCVEKDFQLH
jgi:hypothetical protein